MKRGRLSKAEKDKVADMYGVGKTIEEIANFLDRSVKVVEKIITGLDAIVDVIGEGEEKPTSA